MTYDDAIAFWYGRINYEVKAAGPGDLKLERMRALLRLLHDPHESFRSIHITGTKGKGSTAAMLAAVLRAAGYRVGLFTSPHLVHVEERIQLDGEPISKVELAALMMDIAEAAKNLTDGPTFFEIGTALGFLHFARRRVDLAVVEVGLGGRFDSTNVIRPLVSIVASIGFDHVAQLGHTLDAIAYQKAGIIKRHIPVVSGVTDPASAAVIAAVAKEERAPLTIVGRDFHVEYRGMPNERGQTRAVVTSREKTYGPYELSLLGRHQSHNAALVVETVVRLRESGLNIPNDAVEFGLANTVWPGRIEILSRSPTVVLDTAHNEPSVRALVETLCESVPVTGQKSCVFAVSNDKPFEEMLKLLTGYFDRIYPTKYGMNPRCVPPEQLAEIVKGIDSAKPASAIPIASEALAAAKADAGPDDLICVTGSFFLAGELRPLMVRK